MKLECKKLVSIFLLVLLTATTFTSLDMTVPAVSSGSSSAIEDEREEAPLSGTIGSGSPSANFTCRTFDYGLDTDYNGLYDYLVVDVEVQVMDEGWYCIRGDGLCYDYWDYVDVWDEVEGYFSPGSYNVSLMFPGGPISNRGTNVTKISSIYLFDEYSWLDDKHDIKLSRQYNYTEFDPASRFTCRVFDWGLDPDSDGLYNYLFVDVEVNITDAGLYFINGGGLRDDYGGYVDVWYQVMWNFDYPDIYNVTLMFPGGPIYCSGKNVTKISEIRLFDEEWCPLDGKHGVLLSRPYNYTEFDPVTHFTCRVFDQGLDTDGNGLYDWLEIKVELDVIESDTYHICIEELIDSEWRYLWVWNETEVDLDVGVQNVTLLVYGPIIAHESFNPVNISRIVLWGEHQGSKLSKYKVPLSREYSYTEFDAPFTDYDVTLVVYPDGRVEAEGTVDITHMLYPPGFTEYFDYSILEFEDGFWWSNGSFTMYLPEMYTPFGYINPDEFPFNSTYFSYYEYLSEGINYGDMNFTMLLPPAYEDLFPLNATDFEMIGTFDGVDYEESIHGTLIGNLTTLFTELIGLPFGFNETVDLPLRLLLDYDKGEYNGTLTLYLIEGWPVKLFDIDINGTLSSICLNGSIDVIYGNYGPPINMEITYEWLNATVTGLKEKMLNETIYDMTGGTLECPIVDITLTNITDGLEVIGATVSFEVCIQEVEEYPGVVLLWFMMPMWEMIEYYPSEGLWLLNALNDTLNKIQDTTIELTYTPSTTTTEFWLNGTMHVRDILEQLLEPITPPEWWPWEVPPEINETVLPCVWAFVKMMNASVCSVEDSSIYLSYSSEEGRIDLNSSYTLNYEAMMEAMVEFIPDMRECYEPLLDPEMQYYEEKFYDLMMDLLKGTYVNVTWFEMSMSYEDGVYEQNAASLLEGDLNAAINTIFHTILEVVNATAYPPPPEELMEFLNATDLDLSDFYINAAMEWNTITGSIKLAAYPPIDPVNETSSKLTSLFSLFYGMPIPDSWSQLSIRVEGGANETHQVWVEWPGGEPMPDLIDPYGRFVAWENVSACDIANLIFTVFSNSPATILDPTVYPTSIYRITQNVTISAIVENDLAWETPEEIEVYVNIKDPTGIWVNDTYQMTFNGTHFVWSYDFEGKVAGTYTAVIKVIDLYDAVTESAPMSFDVMNNPPTLTDLTLTDTEILRVTEETILRFNVSDVEGAVTVEATLTKPITGENVSLSLTETNGMWTTTITPNPTDPLGTYTITVTVTDGDSATATKTKTFQALNNPPNLTDLTLTDTEILRVTEETILTFNASDVEGAVTVEAILTKPVTGENVSLGLTETDGTWTVTITLNPTDPLGTYTITVTVTDGDSATATKITTLEALNNEPVIVGIDITAREVKIGETITGSVNASDVEGDLNVTVSFHGPDGWHNITAQLEGGVYTFSTSTEGWAEGEYTVYATATDADEALSLLYQDPEKVTLKKPLPMMLILGGVGVAVVLLAAVILMRRR